MNSITITWHGHSCFTLESGGFLVVTDPFKDDTVPGYKNLRLEADLVSCSHGHGDHNAREVVSQKKPAGENPFTISEIEIPHDDAGGTKRGMNLIRIFRAGDLRVVHFGDIGCPLTEEQAKEIGSPDAVLVPVGGFYTMEPELVAEMLKILKPRVIVPMHYRSESFGYPVIGTLDAFLDLMNESVTRLPGNSFTLTKEAPVGIVVPSYCG